MIASPPRSEIVDVAVVGAGLAGLMAARQLEAVGHTVVVLEARDRVGGRTLNAFTESGDVVEMGGHWIGPTQERVAALADSVDVGTFPTYCEGEGLLVAAGRKMRYETHPPLGRMVATDLALVQARFSRLMRRVDLRNPWDTPGAERLDGMTFETWLRRNVATRGAREIFGTSIAGVIAMTSSEMSLLGALFAVRTATDLETLVGVRGGAQQDRLVGGPQRLSERMAEGLGDRVVLGSSVSRIEERGDSVVVSSKRINVTARRAVVALPPALAARIEYDPPLPSSREGLLQHMPHGSVIKFHVTYDEPFWRADGLSGQAFDPSMPMAWTLDNTPERGSPGVLVGFFEPRAARRYGSATMDERRRVAVQCLERFFGSRAADPGEYLELDWSAERWTRGCYFGQPTPGAWTQFGRALREPCGKIHWAGAETAVYWNGYMDGAVESGERAAHEVAAALDATE